MLPLTSFKNEMAMILAQHKSAVWEAQEDMFNVVSQLKANDDHDTKGSRTQQ